MKEEACFFLGTALHISFHNAFFLSMGPTTSMASCYPKVLFKINFCWSKAASVISRYLIRKKFFFNFFLEGPMFHCPVLNWAPVTSSEVN